MCWVFFSLLNELAKQKFSDEVERNWEDISLIQKPRGIVVQIVDEKMFMLSNKCQQITNLRYISGPTRYKTISRYS